MKSLLLLIFLSSNIYASGISVEDKGGLFYLVKGKKRICEIITVGGSPKFIKEEKLKNSKGLVLLHYYAGTAGTHDLIDNYRACIYNPVTKDSLGDIPYKYVSEKSKLEKPVIKVTNDSIKVIDNVNDENVTIKLK